MRAPGPLRVARFLWREAIRRPMPHGVVHWRFCLRHLSGPLARQRALWRASLPGLPRPAWFLLEAWLWLRWQLWGGPRRVWRTTRRLGHRVRSEEGVGLARQAWRVWTVSQGYCVPPSDVYRFRLYRPGSRARAPEFVYPHTAAAFHHRRNSAADGARASSELLADKELQTAELTRLGIPMVPILAVARRGTGEALGSHADDPAARFFCKPRHGSAGRGAFAARGEGDTIVVETFHGVRLTGPEAAAHWARLLDDDDMLVQLRLSTHPHLADLATADDVVTVRYISERRPPGDGVACYCATLELPAGRRGSARRPAYVVLEVDAESGAIMGVPDDRLPDDRLPDDRLPDDRQAGDLGRRYCDVLARLGERRVPGWDEIRRGSHLAHTRFPGIHAIAWDWAVTPSGPLLLEGNGGWGVSTPQILKGGLLADARPSG